MFCLKNKPDIW